jgi:hypothetical protein
VNSARFDSDGQLLPEDYNFPDHDCSESEDDLGGCHVCDDWEPDRKRSVTHFAVRIGPDTFLDANGALSLHEYAWRHNYEVIELEGPEHLYSIMHETDVPGIYSGMWLEPDIELGRKFVDAVYAQIS